MRKIVLASNNKHKIKEFNEMLGNVEILTLNDVGFNKEIIEDGNSFQENSLIKAKEVSNYLKENNLDYDVIADDSGICLDSLGGKPGIYSARYSGLGTDKSNRDKLIKDLEGKDKTAYFVCNLVLYHIDGTYVHKEGRTYGTITEEEKGDTSFGYDCIFLSKDLNKTFGEATSKEKNSVSHRTRALEELRKCL